MSEQYNISDELLINYLLGECTATEREAVENWLAQSDVNKARYEQFSKVWDHSKELINDVQIDENAAWERMQGRMQEKNKLSFRRTLTAVAASIAVLIGVFWLFNRDTVTPIGPDAHPVIVNVDTPIIQTIESANAPKIKILADASIITLNKKSSLVTPEAFVTNERRVVLKGEAFFSITPDAEKPFIIETQSNVDITVVGTSFNVKSLPKYTEVIVETGIVELKKGNSIMRLKKNEKAHIYSKDSIIKVEKKTDNLYQYYRSKKFDCDNTPLWKVVEVLNEAYEEKIIIKDKSLRNLKLDTQFDNEAIEIVMEVLSETFEFNVTKRGSTYFITR